MERFWSKTKRVGDCLEWQSSISNGGYGLFRMGPKKVSAHRLAYELTYGEIPEGMHICHRCDNPKCVEPEHLFAGTHSDNMRDMVTKGRHAVHDHRGEKSSTAKLTEDDVHCIRQLYQEGSTKTQLAKEFGVTDVNIHYIVTGKSWKHI